MTELDKFYSDAERLTKRALKPDVSGQSGFSTELIRLFLQRAPKLGDLPADLAALWEQRYAAVCATEEARTAACAWFACALALLDGNLEPGQDFPVQDWPDIRDLISTGADDIDINILTDIMSVLVSRRKM